MTAPRKFKFVPEDERSQIFYEAQRLIREYRRDGVDPHQLSIDLAKKYNTTLFGMTKFLNSRGIDCREERQDNIAIDPRYRVSNFSVPIRHKQHMFEAAVQKLAAKGESASFRPDGTCFLDGRRVSGIELARRAGLVEV